MRLIFVTSNSFPEYSGGIESWMYNVILRLPNDINVLVLSPMLNPRYDYKNNFPALDNRVKYVRYKMMYCWKLTNLFTRGYLSVIGNLFHIHMVKSKLEKEINISSDDVIITVDPVCVGKAVNILKKKRKFTYISSIRGPHADVMAQNRKALFPLYSRWERESIYTSDLAIVNGEDTRKLYEQKYGKKLQIMKNGVNIYKALASDSDEITEFEKNVPVIVSVATLQPIKGVFDIVDGLSRYARKYGRNIRVYFIGKGNPENLYLYARELGVEDLVTCLGYRLNPYPYMKEATINICMSGGSGFSMSMLEAMSCKRPIIALDSPVYRQFNETGYLSLVKEKDPDDLAEMINKILCNFDFYLGRCDSIFETAKKFDWSIVTNEFLGYINEAKIISSYIYKHDDEINTRREL